MEARSHVLPDGTYVIGPPKTTTITVTTQTSKKKEGKKNVSHYITMLKTRIGLTNTAGSALAKACTIAARYSALRLQGFQVGSAGVLNSPESQILDYQNQLFRILQWTSSAYAVKFVARWLLKKVQRFKVGMKSGNEEATKDLPEVHSSAAGLKALCCCMTADGIEDLRRACGGHGYMMSSGIAPLEADYKGPNTTAEGDYVVLSLQTARFLIKSVQSARAKEELPGTTQILKPLGDPKFDPYSSDSRPRVPIDLASVLCGDDAKSEATTRKYITDLFAYRSLVKCEQMTRHYEGSYLAATNAGAKDPTGVARSENARTMQTAALSHVRYFMVQKYFEEVESVSAGSPERIVLHRLATFYALSDVVGLQGSGPSWGGLLSAKEVDAFEYAVDRMMKMLRPDVIPLVEAFDISDTILNSALGSSDGKVYEKLFDAAENSAMNVDEQGNRLDVPECLMAVEKYLSRDFLRNGRASAGDANQVGGAKVSTQHAKGKL
jgi:acyl-CoA oxidase